MTIQEAINSGHPFKRPDNSYWYTDLDIYFKRVGPSGIQEAILANDWITKPPPYIFEFKTGDKMNELVELGKIHSHVRVTVEVL